MLLCAKHGLPFGAVAEAYRAALDFACPDENGALFPADAEFRKKYALPYPPEGCSHGGMFPSILTEVSGLDRNDPVDSLVYSVVCGTES
jgi:hypothetical protein